MAIAYENSTSYTIDWSSSMTVSLDAGTNDDRCVLVLAMTDRNSATTINSATYGGVAMTAHTAFNSSLSAYDGRLFYLGGAASGANNIVVTLSDGNTKPKLVAVAYSGVDGTTPVDQLANVATNGTSTVSSTVTSAAGDLVVLICAYLGQTAVTPSAPAVERFDALIGSAVFYGFVWDEDGASSVTINGSAVGNNEWWGTALNLNAAGGGATGVPATNRFMMGVG